MPSSDRVPPVPAVLRLVQTATLGRWRATGESLYREVARVVDAAAGHEVLVSGCGDGLTSEWLATRTGAIVTGVDESRQRIERAEERARGLAMPLPLIYSQAALDDLPHERDVFDSAIGEPAIAAASDPERAVAELVRVTKPMGAVVLLQPTWSSDIVPSAREDVVARLGFRPHLLVEWKQMLRNAGAVEIQVQDWTTGGPGCASRGAGALRDEADALCGQLTWQHKMQIVGRVWRRLGWREARGAVGRETALLRELCRERVLGFQLIKGVKWPHAAALTPRTMRALG